MKKTLKIILSVVLVVVMTIGAAPLSEFVGIELSELNGFKNLAYSVSEFFNGFVKKQRRLRNTQSVIIPILLMKTATHPLLMLMNRSAVML